MNNRHRITHYFSSFGAMRGHIQTKMKIIRFITIDYIIAIAINHFFFDLRSPQPQGCQLALSFI